MRLCGGDGENLSHSRRDWEKRWLADSQWLYRRLFPKLLTRAQRFPKIWAEPSMGWGEAWLGLAWRRTGKAKEEEQFIGKRTHVRFLSFGIFCSSPINLFVVSVRAHRVTGPFVLIVGDGQNVHQIANILLMGNEEEGMA